MSEGKTHVKYHPKLCPECHRDYEWINVIESPRPGEEPDYVFVHDSEVDGEFTRIIDSCRIHEHEANPNWEPTGL